MKTLAKYFAILLYTVVVTLNVQAQNYSLTSSKTEDNPNIAIVEAS